MLFEKFRQMRDERGGDAAFLVASGDRSVPITWRQFTDDIATISWIIKHHAPGATIALLGENSCEWMVVHAACLFSGAVALPVDANLSAVEIADRLRFAGASVLIHSSLYRDKAREISALMPALATGGFGTRKTDAFIFAARKAISLSRRTIWDGPAPDMDRTASIVFTSGTTARPKGVEISLRAIETFVESTQAALPMQPGMRSLMLLPLYHIFGIAATYTMLASGVALGVCPDFRRVYAAFERFRVNFAFLVPAVADILAAKIAHSGKSAEEAFGWPIDWILTGGAPLQRRTYEKLNALGVKTICGYGLTETAACCSMSFSSDEPRVCSAGKVSTAPGVELKVSDGGEILVRGPCLMKGYFKDPEATAKVMDGDGWFHTGDTGTIDRDGYVWLKGRLSRTIVMSSGKKVAPEELEEKISALPGVIEVVVSGDGETREILAEVYASVPDESVRRAVAALNKILPVYKRVTKVVVRREPFPRTASGKISLARR